MIAHMTLKKRPFNRVTTKELIDKENRRTLIDFIVCAVLALGVLGTTAILFYGVFKVAPLLVEFA